MSLDSRVARLFIFNTVNHVQYRFTKNKSYDWSIVLLKNKKNNKEELDERFIY